MKVLRKGNNNEWRWVGKCPSCQAIIEMDTRELRGCIEKGAYRSDNEDWWAWKKCPECVGRICFHRADSKSGKNVLAEVSG